MAVNDVFADAMDDGAPGTNGAPFFVPEDGTFVAGERAGSAALAGWPWRGLMLAVGLHVSLVVGMLLWGRAHLPPPPPDGAVISVVTETLPRGSPASVSQVDAAARIPTPSLPPTPLAEVPRQMRQPLPKPVRKSVRSLPPRPKLPPGASRAASRKIGNMIIAATRPASPDAGSTVYYSEIARELGEQGEVRLRIVISPSGKPERVTMEKSSGYARLDEDARNSVLTWHFQPAVKHGMPVESALEYWVRFQLQ